MYLAILCVPVTSAGTAARVHVCHSHMQIVMPAACDSFAPVLLLLRQDGPRQSRLHVVCVCARGGGGGVSSQAHHRGHREEVWKPAYKFWDTRILPAKDNSGFMRDRYTLLPETRERIVATEVTAWWSR
uniref:Uncharacterized protein n=1 Tax=Triticum urartu TaxID=4572 RepID=A0A8R7VJH1_TRIUA